MSGKHTALYDRKKQLQRYGLTLEDYQELLEAQDGVCAICGGPQIGKRENLSVDHDHETDKIRGLLCHGCNSALSWFGDDLDGILRVVKYLSGAA